MAKIISDKELAEIVSRAINKDEIDDYEQYLKFLQDLATVVTDHFGGETGLIEIGADGVYYVAVRHDECVPEDGGIWKDYDKDISIEEWREDAKIP